MYLLLFIGINSIRPETRIFPLMPRLVKKAISGQALNNNKIRVPFDNGEIEMSQASRDFQVFAKPAGAMCNMACSYCYYLKNKNLIGGAESFRMNDDILEEYIRRHLEAAPSPNVYFSWHGGEPTLLGLDYFKKIPAFQKKHKSLIQFVYNGVQTNGLLIDEEWARFLSKEKFAVGLSMDGPPETHDRFRVAKNGNPTHKQVLRAFNLLRDHQIDCDILCVVNSDNARRPAELYGYFKEIGVRCMTFLPLVEPLPNGGVSNLTVQAEEWGEFLCTVFDIWKKNDVGPVKIQIIEETARAGYEQDHSLCIFRKTCGDVPVIEHNGDVYSCDHFVDSDHRLGNIMENSLADLLERPEQIAFGLKKQEALPLYCRECNVLEMCNGGCPKDRFIKTPDGETGLNFLCAGYKRFFEHCRPFVLKVAEINREAMEEFEKNPHRWEKAFPFKPEVEKHYGPEPIQFDKPETIKSKMKKIGRNAPCPCGSGRKYKKCCLDK